MTQSLGASSHSERAFAGDYCEHLSLDELHDAGVAYRDARSWLDTQGSAFVNTQDVLDQLTRMWERCTTPSDKLGRE